MTREILTRSKKVTSAVYDAGYKCMIHGIKAVRVKPVGEVEISTQTVSRAGILVSKSVSIFSISWSLQLISLGHCLFSLSYSS